VVVAMETMALRAEFDIYIAGRGTAKVVSAIEARAMRVE